MKSSSLAAFGVCGAAGYHPAMLDGIELAPMPRRVEPRAGSLRLSRAFVAPANHANKQTLEWLTECLPVAGSSETPITLALDPAAGSSPEAYLLDVTPQGVQINGASPAGLFRAANTFLQLANRAVTAEDGPPRDKNAPVEIPCVHIVDWPDFPVRGAMLDISRDKVPTMATLKRLIDWFASIKINQLQLYTEHTFAYRGHKTVWKDASPITPAEARALDAYCRARFIELVPNQNCFGHMERWLAHKRYAPLAEATGPWNDPFGGTRTARTTLNPVDPNSLRLVSGLLRELYPIFKSRMVNVGCDETWELGQGRSKAACKKRGAGRVYLDFLLKLHGAVKRKERTMQFWADIIHEYPDLIPDLPSDLIPLEWGYEADHPFDAHCAALKSVCPTFYVCPGTSSWCSYAGRTQNALGNLRTAAEAGKRHGATGYLITDWGDGGHHQQLPASYLPLLYGAAVSWCADANANMNAAVTTSRIAFGDPTGAAGRLWAEMGGVYRTAGVLLKNQSLLYRCMIVDLFKVLDGTATGSYGLPPDTTAAMLNNASEQIDALIARVTITRTPHNQRLTAEALFTLDLMRQACARGLAMVDARAGRRVAWRELARDTQRLIDLYPDIWSGRNRPGGMLDSLRHFKARQIEYMGMAMQRPATGQA